MERKNQYKAWLYLSPAIVLLLIFTVWPIINTVRMAFLEGYSGLMAVGGASFKFGIGNFVKVVKYQRFLQCLKNTVLLCVWTVPLSTVIALLIAVGLNSIKRFQKILQTIFFLPYVTNSIAIGMVFAAMFNIVGSFFGTENELVVTAGIINNVIEFMRMNETESERLKLLLPELTPSEIKICQLILRDKKLGEICSILNKSESNINTQRGNIRKKLGLQPTDNLQKALEKRVM